MAENNNLMAEISIDKYDLEKNWLERIAPKYLDVDNLNHLKVGLYGYINEVMATSLRYATAHRNFLYDESFLNTASLTKSIYNKAKSYNYEIPMAKPASMDITFTITQRDIMTYGTKVLEGSSYTYTLRLSANDKYFCNKIPFMAENDITIKATKMVDGTYSYIAQYDRSAAKDNKGLFSGSTNPYIPIWVNRATITNDTDVITIQYKIYQVTKTEKVFENFSSDLSDNLYFDQSFSDNLANFTVKYKTQIVDTYLNAYFNDTFTPEEPYYCYYNFSNSQLTIFFSGLPGNFKPTINSRLYLDVYTTLGAGGNFKYSGEITHQFSDPSLNRYMIDRTVVKLQDPSGGTNMPTRGEVKQALIHEFLTRNNLITEFDLNTYFNNIVNDQIINSSKMLFIKRRDDVLKRTYVGFALLRDQTGLIIPSNTIDLECKNFSFNEEFHIPSGSLIGYKNGKYVLLDDEISLNDGNLKYYKGVPTYFRKDDFIFIEAEGNVDDKLENLLYADGDKKYILYKDLDSMLPSYVRFRNHYLHYQKKRSYKTVSNREASEGLASSISDFIFVGNDNTIYFRLTNDIAENLEVNVKKEFPDNPFFIIYTMDKDSNNISSYDSLESEYIRYEIAKECGFDDIRDIRLPNKEQFFPPEGGVDTKDKVSYVKVDEILLKDRLGITEENSIHIVQKDDGYFYIPFTNDNRFKNNEKLLNFFYYEDKNLCLKYNADLKAFLDTYEFEEISVYNFDTHIDPVTKKLKNYIISESPVNGQYYKDYENELNATYLYKKLYFWLKDEEFKKLVESIGGYTNDTEYGDQDEVYTSYDYSPPRVFLRYKEEYDKKYFNTAERNNLTEPNFRDRNDVFFTDKVTNCILEKNLTFLRKDLLDYKYREDEYVFYTHNGVEYVIYDSSDSRMKSVAEVNKDGLVHFVPYELPKYIELTPYVRDLKKYGIIDYKVEDIYELSDNKLYIPYKEEYQIYKNNYKSKSSRLFGSFTWVLEYNDYVKELLSNEYNKDQDVTYLVQEEDIKSRVIDGELISCIDYKSAYENILSDETQYRIFYYINYTNDPNRPEDFFKDIKLIYNEETGKIESNGEYDNWIRINDFYNVDGEIFVRFDSTATDYELFTLYNENGYLQDKDYKLISTTVDEETGVIYRIPFALHYINDGKSYPRLVAIQNTLDKNLYFNFKEINGNISSEFILNNININRSSITYDRLISDDISEDVDSKVSKRVTKMTNGFIETTVKMEYDTATGELLDSYKKLDPEGNAFAVPVYNYKVTNDINRYFLSFKLNTTLFANIRSTMADIKAREDGLKTYFFNTDGEYYDYCKEKKVLVVRCLMKDAFTDKYIGFFDFENDSFSNLEFNYEFVTDNNLIDNKLNLINCIRNLDDGNELLENVYIPEKVTLELCFLVKILRDSAGNPYYSDTKVLSTPLDRIKDYDNDGNELEYSCAVRMESNTPFHFFKTMTDVINPILDVESRKDALMIRELPVIGKHYLYNYSVFKDFFNTFGVYYDILKDSFDKLENNTSVNLKFYNTYGPSNYFHSKGAYDINTNINMKLSIKLVDSYTQELDFKIKNFILDFVEKINESSNNVFAVSNLIRELEKNFEDISYIEFEELNGVEIKSDGNQVIFYDYPSIKDMTKEQLINYVPEYLNVHVYREAYIQGSENFQVGIVITYK